MEKQLNILVYYPGKAPKRINAGWLYGFDIVKELVKKHPEWNFSIVDGSQKNIYKNINVYLRPSRHDGASRMIEECKFLGIPYIWSYESGKYREPKLKEIERRLESIGKKLVR